MAKIKTITVKEIAEAANVHVNTVTAWRKLPDFPPLIETKGRTMYFSAVAFKAWLKAHPVRSRKAA